MEDERVFSPGLSGTPSLTYYDSEGLAHELELMTRERDELLGKLEEMKGMLDAQVVAAR